MLKGSTYQVLKPSTIYIFILLDFRQNEKTSPREARVAIQIKSSHLRNSSSQTPAAFNMEGSGSGEACVLSLAICRSVEAEEELLDSFERGFNRIARTVWYKRKLGMVMLVKGESTLVFWQWLLPLRLVCELEPSLLPDPPPGPVELCVGDCSADYRTQSDTPFTFVVMSMWNFILSLPHKYWLFLKASIFDQRAFVVGRHVCLHSGPQH